MVQHLNPAVLLTHRFLSGMRMVWKASTGLDTEVVQHQEGRKVAQLRGADAAADARACAFGLLDGQKGLANGS
jgi:hypothetical protein